MNELAQTNTNTLAEIVNHVAKLPENKVKTSLADAINNQDSEIITAHLIDFLNREQSSKALSDNSISSYSTAANQYLAYCFENGLNLLKPTVRQSQNYKTEISNEYPVQQTRVTSQRVNGKVKKITVDWEYIKNSEGEKIKQDLPMELKTPSPSSINRNLGVAKNLHRMINTVLEKNVANPFDNVKAVKAKSVSNDSAYSADDRAKLFAVATGDLKTVLALTGFGALRITEALTLTWSDIDLKNDTLTVRAEHSKNKDAGTIVITAELKKVLEGLTPKRGLVVAGSQTRFTVYQQLKTLCKNHDVVFKGVHGLRHTALQQTLDSTGSREATMMQGRHKSQSSSNRYAATSLDDVKKMLATKKQKQKDMPQFENTFI